MEKLTESDLILIKESLQYTKQRFENYQDYPSKEIKSGRIFEVEQILLKVNNLLKNPAGLK